MKYPVLKTHVGVQTVFRVCVGLLVLLLQPHSLKAQIPNPQLPQPRAQQMWPQKLPGKNLSAGKET